VLGRINPDYFLGGRMDIYPDMAREAIEENLCEPLSKDLTQTASGVITIVDAHMVRAIRNVSVAKGYDPREFTLLGFGGAGPLHAVAVAKELGIRNVLIPENPGTFSSLGLLVADFRSDFVKTNIIVGKPENIERINGMFPDLEAMAERWLSKEKVPAPERILERFIDMRYQRQNYEYRIELSEERFTPQNFDHILWTFHEEHKKIHGYALYDSPVEFVNYRVTACGCVQKADVVSYPEGGESSEKALKGYRKVCFDPQIGFVSCPIYELERLAPRNRIHGPAVIEQMGSTILVPPTERAVVDNFKNIRIHIGSKKGSVR
jgi:N-methylhydantoinase A